MSARGIEFLENWIQENVTAADRRGDSMRAMVLADRCRADAAAHGFAIDNVELECGSVERFIYEAMAHLKDPGVPGN
jgi:hypothetical protein